MNKLKSLSIIFPCYNEALNIPRLIEVTLGIAPQIANEYEIIIVNDGSIDNTSEVLENYKDIANIKVINQKNMGYGGALMSGFSKAKMDWIFFTDSDLQFDIKEIALLIPYTDTYKFIFGYRKKRADKMIRKIIASMLKVWNKVWLDFPLGYKDIDCAFKLLNRDSFLSIGNIQSSGAMINTEMILRIKRNGFRIKQIGVSHYPREEGKSTGSNINVILKAVKETFMLRKILKR